MDVSLVMFKSDGTRRDFVLRKAKTVVGRTHACDLRIPLSSVSRTHCQIVMEHGDLFVRDLGSSNGTFVNDVRVKDEELEIGDELTVGPVVFTIVIDGKPEQVDPVHTFAQPAEQSAAGASGATGVPGVPGAPAVGSAVLISPAATAANQLSAVTAPQTDQPNATKQDANQPTKTKTQPQAQHSDPDTSGEKTPGKGDTDVQDAATDSQDDHLENDPIAALQAMANDDSDFSGEFASLTDDDKK